MPCRRCRERVKYWNGSDPVCGWQEVRRRDGSVADYVFRRDNWRCATLDALRDAAKDAVWNEDEWAALLPIPDTIDVVSDSGGRSMFIALQWYKRRGCTTGAWEIDNNGHMRLLTLHAAEQVAACLDPPRRDDDPGTKGGGVT